MKHFILFLIHWYQKSFSKDHRDNPRGFCKFTPSCSEYAKLCFEKYNILFATLKSFWRILRCNPFSKGGVDLP
ncbi:membrane protein insertion efficiency factor YidD [Candidatus Peregrinibacteria bacterium]|nr:membrane protein insertion efficiency factor YidD [Candidatus Peregrinibacteria bacterium]